MSGVQLCGEGLGDENNSSSSWNINYVSIATPLRPTIARIYSSSCPLISPVYMLLQEPRW